MAKSTLKDITTSILDTDIAKAINPFEIFAKRVDISLESPHVLVLENWIYQNSDLMNKALFLPKGKVYLCVAYGRFWKRPPTKGRKFLKKATGPLGI